MKFGLQSLAKKRSKEWGEQAKARIMDMSQNEIKRILGNFNQGVDIELLLTEDPIWIMNLFNKWEDINFQKYGMLVQGKLFDLRIKEKENLYSGKIILADSYYKNYEFKRTYSINRILKYNPSDGEKHWLKIERLAPIFERLFGGR